MPTEPGRATERAEGGGMGAGLASGFPTLGPPVHPRSRRTEARLRWLERGARRERPSLLGQKGLIGQDNAARQPGSQQQGVFCFFPKQPDLSAAGEWEGSGMGGWSSLKQSVVGWLLETTPSKSMDTATP